MKNELKILGVWFLLLSLLRLLLFLPHGYIEPMGLINASLQLLLCLLSIRIAMKSYGSHKFIYVNFAVFFGFVVPLVAHSFVGSALFPKAVYANMYYRFYINKFGLDFILLFTLFYVTIDYFLNKRGVMVKYLSSFLITSCIVAFCFFPFLLNPFQLYEQKEFVALRNLEQTHQEFTTLYNREPNDYELAQKLADTQRNESKENDFTSTLSTTRELTPYLKEGGETPIFWKPLSLISMYVNGIVLFLISSVLYYSYRFNKAHHAYQDKILILLFLTSALEIFHTYGYVHSYSTETYHVIFKLGQYFTIAVLLLLVYTFDLKLRFVLSPAGNYYEKILETSPSRITRWRDEIDNLILKTFSKNNKILKHIGYITVNKEKGKELTQ